jgi:hypothetical protein
VDAKPSHLVLVTGAKCLHSIGKSDNHVCLKDCEEGYIYCEMKHQGVKFGVSEETLMVVANSSGTTAYSTLNLAVSKLKGRCPEKMDLLYI